MAIWQYKLFILPKEEVISYFENQRTIGEDDFNEIEWWKYRQLTADNFNSLVAQLPQNISWSRDIILFGNTDSNCVELLYENNIAVEVSGRIDLSYDYSQFVSLLCNIAQENECIFLSSSLEILNPDITTIQNDIDEYTLFKDFIDK
ncbi:MAG: hypothetical protein V4663_15915 [Bacteroidota bacterium]